jgi:putative iron-regulated protein
MTMSNKAIALAFATGLGLAVLPGATPAAFAAAPTVKDIMTNYGDVAEAMYSDSLAKAKDLQKVVDAFLAKPTTENMVAALIAWKETRVTYMLTDVYGLGN